VDVLDACAGHLRLVVAWQLVSFATMVAGRGRTAVAVAAVLGPSVDDLAETKAVTLRRAGAPGGSVRTTGRAALRRWGSRGASATGASWGARRARRRHPDQLGRLVLGS
jgi:hypothetical protein